jgi:amidase
MFAAMTPQARASAPASEDELLFKSVMLLSQSIRAKEVSSEEVVRAYLDRIAVVNPALNAVVTLSAEKAIEGARAADAELARGQLRGVLHGVPMTIKDSFDTAGVVSTAGTEGRKSFVPKRDATVVARLRSAGAILLGKTNTPEFTMSCDTRNLLFGFTKNPYDTSKSPGGSSGGAAAAIAAGASPFDMGSDTGGSIRVPSCFCGIAGIKPTTGRMPLTGHVICTGQSAADPLTQVGPMARYVDDLFPLLRITAGVDGKDPAVVPMPLEQPFFVKLKGLRVAFHTDNGIVAAAADVRRTVESAVAALSDVGARVEESCPKVLASLTEFWNLPYVVDGGQWVKTLLKQSGTQRWDPHLDWHWQNLALSGEQVGELLRTWHRFRVEMMSWMNHYDVLICPVNARASWVSGFDHDDESMKAFTYTATYNLTGWPGAVVRAGTGDDGMPIGVQVVSRPWCEHICLAVAKHLETTLGGWRRPPI